MGDYSCVPGEKHNLSGGIKLDGTNGITYNIIVDDRLIVLDMSTLSIRIPDSSHGKVKEISKTDNISINQFIASAVGEKIAALETENYLHERAKRASEQKVKEILLKIPDAPPDIRDREKDITKCNLRSLELTPYQDKT